MKINVYQSYYEKSQISYLNSKTIPYFNSNLNVLFENQILLDIAKNQKISGDYFGLLSWKFEFKNRKNIDVILNQLKESDVYSFSTTIANHNVLAFAEKCHPGFLKLFELCLNYINLKISDFYKLNLGLYQNAIIAKSEIYLDYINNYLNPICGYLITDSVASELANRDSLYAGYGANVAERLKNQLGIDYYPFHTFICERLWSIYVANNPSLSLKIL